MLADRVPCRRYCPRALAPVRWALLLSLGFGLELSHTQNPVQLLGTAGESVGFSIDVPSDGKNPEIQWRYGEEKIIIALVDERQSTLQSKTQFSERLEAYIGGSLKINNLKTEDSGIYQAVAVFSDRPQIDQEFELHVFERVSKPSINVTSHHEPLSDVACNVTLVCSVKNGTDVSFSWWKKGNRVLNDPKHHLIRENILEVLLHPEDSTITYSCRVRNRVSEEVESVTPWKSCAIKPNGLSTSAVAGIIILVLLVLAVVAAAAVYFIKRQTGLSPKPPMSPVETFHISEPKRGCDTSPSETEHTYSIPEEEPLNKTDEEGGDTSPSKREHAFSIPEEELLHKTETEDGGDTLPSKMEHVFNNTEEESLNKTDDKDAVLQENSEDSKEKLLEDPDLEEWDVLSDA